MSLPVVLAPPALSTGLYIVCGSSKTKKKTTPAPCGLFVAFCSAGSSFSTWGRLGFLGADTAKGNRRGFLHLPRALSIFGDNHDRNTRNPNRGIDPATGR